MVFEIMACISIVLAVNVFVLGEGSGQVCRGRNRGQRSELLLFSLWALGLGAFGSGRSILLIDSCGPSPQMKGELI